MSAAANPEARTSFLKAFALYEKAMKLRRAADFYGHRAMPKIEPSEYDRVNAKADELEMATWQIVDGMQARAAVRAK